MKHTKNPTVNKFVVVISLWLLAMIVLSTILALRTSLLVFTFVALVLAILLFLLNASFLSFKMYRALRITPKQEENYNR